MKKIIVKRLLYRNINTNEVYYGGEEYDGHLTANNILGSVYVIGKYVWYNNHSLYQLDEHGTPIYQIYVEQFEQYQKSWYNLMMDEIKRILRI